MKVMLIPIFLLILSSSSFSGDHRILTSLYTAHLEEKNWDFNNSNNLIGYEYSWDEYMVGSGTYVNSFDSRSYYINTGIEADLGYYGFRGAIGLVSGYEESYVTKINGKRHRIEASNYLGNGVSSLLILSTFADLGHVRVEAAWMITSVSLLLSYKF